MRVEIPDRDALGAAGQCVERGHGDVIEKAKPIAWSRVA
jgi:hypothetical protein